MPMLGDENPPWNSGNRQKKKKKKKGSRAYHQARSNAIENRNLAVQEKIRR